MAVKNEIVERATGNIAISKLVPVGEFLDLADTGVVECSPERYRALAAAVVEMLTEHKRNPLVRKVCADSLALTELLENVDFASGAKQMAFRSLVKC